MPMESGFFNSKNGDRKYNARDISRYFEHILSSGLFKNITDCMKVTAAGGMNLTVAPGAGLINCQWFRQETPETLTIGTANAALPRFDTVVVRLDMSDSVRAITLDIVPGAPAASPVETPPVRTETIHELVLALVYVPAGTTSIVADYITDVRDNEWYCDWVHSRVDTPVLKMLSSEYVAPVNNTTVIPVNVAAFSPSVDIVNVYVNGFHMSQGSDYTINEANKTIVLALGVSVGTVVNVEVYKPTMPDDIPTTSEAVTALLEENTALQTRVTALEADTGWIEIPWEGGATSNPNWTARLRRVGKSIFLRGLCTSIAANEAQIATIPEGYRPTMGGHAYAGFCSNSSGGNTRAARMFIETSGAVVFRSAGSAAPSSGDVINISTSWLID